MLAHSREPPDSTMTAHVLELHNPRGESTCEGSDLPPLIRLLMDLSHVKMPTCDLQTQMTSCRQLEP